MSENKLNDIIGTSLEKIRALADGETVIGNPINTPNGTTIIPVSRVSMGFASGGLDYSGKKAETAAQNFGGGGGTGVTVSPVAFLLEFLSLHTNLHPSHRADIAVIPDFLSERSTADCKIVFSLRVYAILGLGIRFFYRFLTNKTKNLRTAQNKEDTSCLKTN